MLFRSGYLETLLSVMTLPDMPEIGLDLESRELSVAEGNILVYIAGYICRKIKEKVCSECIQKLYGKTNANNILHTFLAHKIYKDTKGEGLLVPSSEFYSVIEQLEKEYRKVIEGVTQMSLVRYRVVSALSKKVDHYHCLSCTRGKCEIKSMILNLFVMIRLHHTLRVSSHGFVNSNTRRNRKVMKFSHV